MGLMKTSDIVTYLGSVIVITTALSILSDFKTSTAAINKKIAEVKDPKQKEMLIATQKLREEKALTLKQWQTVSSLTAKCQSELSEMLKIISGKNFENKTERVAALQNLITIKGYLEQIKNIGVPIDAELKQVRALEDMLYQSVRN